MAIVNAPTPPQELFRDLVDLANVLFGLLTGPQVAVRRWPVYYMVYVEVDGLCRAISRTTGYLSRAFTEPDGSVNAARIEGVNACLARVDRHVRMIVELLGRVTQHRLIDHGNPALMDIVRMHFSPQSRWYRDHWKAYRAGHVSPNGRVLERTVLLLDPCPSQEAGIGEKNPVEKHTFDLASGQSQAVLARAARQVQMTLNQVYTALGSSFAQHCPSVKDLLYPSML